MFTGIIEELGTVEKLEARSGGARLRVRCRAVLGDAAEGASISVNGVCLTEAELRKDLFGADVSPETLRRTNLGDLRPGTLVNLERPLTPGGRLGGHIVQGHVDGTGEFVSAEPLGSDNWLVRTRFPAELDLYLVFKGSVAIDGISLTVAEAAGGVLSVAVIPHTWRNTNLRARRPGDRLNLECDILAKYVEKMLTGREAGAARPELTEDKLREMGY